MHDEILFNVDHVELSTVSVIKLDDLYYLRPSLYRDGGATLTDTLEIEQEAIDIFDGMVMSVATSLLLKGLKLDNNFILMLIAIIEYETSILVDDTDKNIDAIYKYLLIFKLSVIARFEDSLNGRTDTIMDVTFTFIDNKQLCHAMIAKE